MGTLWGTLLNQSGGCREIFLLYVGVNICGHRNGRMAHEFLRGADVNSRPGEPGAVVMPQAVRHEVGSYHGRDDFVAVGFGSCLQVHFIDKPVP